MILMFSQRYLFHDMRRFRHFAAERYFFSSMRFAIAAAADADMLRHAVLTMRLIFRFHALYACR